MSLHKIWCPFIVGVTFDRKEIMLCWALMSRDTGAGEEARTDTAMKTRVQYPSLPLQY